MNKNVDVLEVLKKLPVRCYYANTKPGLFPTDSPVVMVKRGVMGCYPWGASAKDGESLEEHVARLNGYEDASPAHCEAMLVGSMFGWEVPGADPDSYKPEDVMVRVL